MRKVSITFLVLVLATGCVTRRSVSGDPEFRHLLGLRLQTTSELFLVKTATGYRLSPEWNGSVLGIPSGNRAPTFDEFRSGSYKHRWQSGDEYAAILPRGTRFETVDVVRQDHIELGTTWDILAAIVTPTELRSATPVAVGGFWKLSEINWVPNLKQEN